MVSSEGLCRVWTEFDSGEISGHVQSLARNGPTSIRVVTTLDRVQFWSRFNEQGYKLC